MNDESNQPREHSDTKPDSENYKMEKKRMDYEGGNQGQESINQNSEHKNQKADPKKHADRDTESPGNAGDQRNS